MLLAALVFSSVLTLLATGARTFLDYRERMRDIDKQIKDIEAGHLPVIIENLWVMDKVGLRTAVKGIMQIYRVGRLRIQDKGNTVIEVGDIKSRHFMQRDFPLYYEYKDRKLHLGTMQICIELDGIYKGLWKDTWLRLLYQGIQVFLMAFFIFFLFQLLVTRHLAHIAAYFREMGAVDLQRELTLKGKKAPDERPDELDEVVTAINSMRVNLKNSFEQLETEIEGRKKAEAERRKLIADLRDALANIKTLSGMLPICASCKKIRDDKGYWNRIETYLSEHSDVLFTHGLCPECTKKAFEELEEFKKEDAGR